MWSNDAKKGQFRDLRPERENGSGCTRATSQAHGPGRRPRGPAAGVRSTVVPHGNRRRPLRSSCSDRTRATSTRTAAAALPGILGAGGPGHAAPGRTAALSPGRPLVRRPRARARSQRRPPGAAAGHAPRRRPRGPQRQACPGSSWPATGPGWPIGLFLVDDRGTRGVLRPRRGL